MKIVRKEVNIGEKKLIFEVGKFAKFANGSVVGRYGDTMVLATIVSSKKKSKLSYFPLTVEYAERLYAGGKIKGSRWVKREGRPSDDAILSARLIDRSIRPLFPKDYKNDVQIVVTILSVDGENDPDVLSINTVSAAIAISDIPWSGPIAAVRVGMIEEKDKPNNLIVNPLLNELEYSRMDLVVSSTKDKVMMIEGGLNQVSEKDTLLSISEAKKESQKIINVIEELVKETGLKKQVYDKQEVDKNLIDKLKKQYSTSIDKIVLQRLEKDDGEDLGLLVDEVIQKEGKEVDKEMVLQAVDIIYDQKIRSNILAGKRPDGRKNDEIRPINIQLGLLPRTHGSAVFERGQTQALSIVTLASPSLEQLIESAEGEETKRYIHHYNMPPYSVGETGRFGWPSRREIGHGALAERALLPVIPAEDKFPYTIRVVSEVMSSNGSTSMASTCGSTLALMDAGVPILSPVAGISIGLIEEGQKHVLLTDIMGIEDFCGDMDFKVAGTKEGITAIQLDVKNKGLTDEVIIKALSLAKQARDFILEKMLAVINTPRTQISQFAPKVVLVKVPLDKIGAVIGPGGKVIRRIISETGVTVDVNDEDETVTVSGTDSKMVEKAKAWVEGLIKEAEVGEVYDGEVKRILNFGAFVEIFPGKEGLVHVSKMANEFVKNPNDIVAIGDKVKVKVVEIDDQGRINLSMLLEGKKEQYQKRSYTSPFKKDRG